MAYETFDFDLREGKAREEAFLKVMLRSKTEHKRDKKAWITGNHALEFEQVCRDGVTRPSGIGNSTAERWAVEYYPECWVTVPIEYARGFVERAKKQGRTKWIGDNNGAHCALVPLIWFLRPGEV